VSERIFLSPPHIGETELELVKEVFDSNFIAPVGPMLESFEKAMAEYINIPHTVAVSSGTAAMHLIMRHLGIQAGDVVLASTLNFIGSVSPVVFEGGSLFFIDAESESWNIDPERLAEGIKECRQKGKNIKAVIATDLYGQCVDLDRIKGVCDKYAIPVIVDSAESLGSSYKDRPAGNGAYASIYSFNGNKIITTSGGGVVASEDKALIDHARKLSTQARDDFPYYQHSEIGFNYRMSNVLAAIGMGQLQVLDERVSRRQAINRRYRELLLGVPGISFMPSPNYGKSNCWLTVVQLDPQIVSVTPEDVRCALEKDNIETRPVWKPMHMQPVFADSQIVEGCVAESIFLNGLCLPSGTNMSDSDIERVVDCIVKIL
jgi:dTDP-4-amino-4,6-dideoxygalactose transaminase